MKHITLLISTVTMVTFGNPVRSQEKIESSISGNSITWTISEPDVKKSSEQFQQIVFAPNDKILITATGCAQTGGSGHTWKKYVNPSGPNSDRLYSGMILIPGVTLGIERIGRYVNKPLFIPNNFRSNSFLTLGYQDDEYGDNGYMRHDNGTEDQCKGSGNVQVVITITHQNGPPPDQPQQFKEFDIVAKDWDVNGLPLNPTTGGQLTGAGLSSLFDKGDNFFPNHTTFPVTIESNGICSNDTRIVVDFFSGLILGAFDGLIDPKLGDRSGYPGDHINFMPVAYQGAVTWDDHGKDDDDYNLNLKREDKACYTSNNEQLLIEFDSDETVDHYDNGTWWSDFHHKGVDNSKSAADSMINNKDAFVIGLLGIDAQHGPHFELHPVFVFFIKDTAVNTDTYHFFVRNWGNEGMCSEHKQYLDLNAIQLKIPNAGTLITRNVFCGANNSNITGMSWLPTSLHDGVLLTFNLKNPDEESWFEGDLTFERIVSSQPLQKRVKNKSSEQLHTRGIVTRNKNIISIEEIAERKISGLAPDIRERLHEELKGSSINKKSFLIAPTMNGKVAPAFQRHSNYHVVINRDYVKVRSSRIIYKKNAQETIQILSKYFPVQMKKAGVGDKRSPVR